MGFYHRFKCEVLTGVQDTITAEYNSAAMHKALSLDTHCTSRLALKHLLVVHVRSPEMFYKL